MPKNAGQKLRLFRLRDILFKHTDREHLINRAEIERHLEAYDMTLDKKTFYSDLEAIEEYTDKELLRSKMGRDYGYGVPEEMRDFTLAELKLMADCILSAKFLTESQSYHFLHKLEAQCSVHEAKQLRRQVYLTGKTRLEQTEVFRNVDILNRAIDEDLQVRFRYFNWNVEKNKEYRHGGLYYRVSPWALTWDDGRYYLIGDDMESAERNIRHYRIDKMEDVHLSKDCRAFSQAFEGLRKAEYSEALFGMFGGNLQEVQLTCENAKAGIILDRFGADRMLIPEGKDHFKVYVKVIDSDQFYSWIISLGKGIRVTGPESAVTKMQAITRRLQETYSDESTNRT